MPLSQFMESVIRASGLLEYYTEKDEVASTGKVNNLEQLVHAAGEYKPGPEGLTQFLEDMELDRSLTQGEGQDAEGVTLITMHNTKGLEFDRVIITGLEEGLFPSSRSETEEEIEEERRIFYVSLTRARRELYLTACRRRLLWGRWQTLEPSFFLQEIPREVVEIRGKDSPHLRTFSFPGGGRRRLQTRHRGLPRRLRSRSGVQAVAQRFGTTGAGPFRVGEDRPVHPQIHSLGENCP